MCTPLDRTPYTRAGSSVRSKSVTASEFSLSHQHRCHREQVLENAQQLFPESFIRASSLEVFLLSGEAGISQKPQSSLGLPA